MDGLVLAATNALHWPEERMRSFAGLCHRLRKPNYLSFSPLQTCIQRVLAASMPLLYQALATYFAKTPIWIDALCYLHYLLTFLASNLTANRLQAVDSNSRA